MGVLDLFGKAKESAPVALPGGSFTVNSQGRVIASTLPLAFPKGAAAQIGLICLAAFREAQQAQLPLSELIVNYTQMKITARELRGGAIIFLAPRHGRSSVGV